MTVDTVLTRRKFAAIALAATASLIAARRAAADVVVQPDAVASQGTQELLADAEASYEQIMSELAVLVERAEKAQYAMDETQAELDARSAEIYDLSSAVASLESDVSSLKGRFATQVQSSYSSGDQRPTRLMLECGDDWAAVAEAFAEYPDMASLASQIAAKQSDLSAKSSELAEARSVQETLSAQIARDRNALEDSVAQMQAKADDLRDTVAELEARAEGERRSAEEAWEAYITRLAEEANVEVSYDTIQAVTKTGVEGIFDPSFQSYTGPYWEWTGDKWMIGAAVVAFAYQYLGVPYVWGGSTPSGFDCSGLAQYCYGLAGYSIPRVTYDQIDWIKSLGNWITDPAYLNVGDLVFPHEGHVQIYIGGGQVIHAPQPGDVVKIADMYGFLGGGSPV